MNQYNQSTEWIVYAARTTVIVLYGIHLQILFLENVAGYIKTIP